MSDNRYMDILPVPDEANGFKAVPGGKARFLLGTDRHIGAPENPEKRVAIIPGHCRMLIDWLAELHIKLDLVVVKGAGDGAGYPDSEFEAAGARLIGEDELHLLEDNPPCVVHALKESTHYEARIPGNFLRIGALHSGDFHPASGLAEVMRENRYRAVFDGSAVGGFASRGNYPIKPKFVVPLRSSMSVYAGKLAGEDVGNHMSGKGRVVVSGGGIVGTSAVGVLLEQFPYKATEILIVEKFQSRCDQLKKIYENAPSVRIEKGDVITDEHLDGAGGLILTIFVQGSGATPNVVRVDQLNGMQDGAAIVDVAIDEGGGIWIPKHETGEKVLAQDVRAAIDGLGKGHFYEADNHMPRRKPREASIEHGETALMYLASMLHLCAAHGGPAAALTFIQDQDYIFQPKRIAEALVLDLKHGLAFANANGATVLYRHNLKKCDEISAFLTEHNIPNTFA